MKYLSNANKGLIDRLTEWLTDLLIDCGMID